MYSSQVNVQIFNKKQGQFIFAVVGNPNSGKSTVFNKLTGLRQKIGNFPGVTVEKKLGKVHLTEKQEATLIDFPGTYSFYPTSQDERIVLQAFINPQDENYPDAVIYVADVNRLEKHLLLFTQIKDLGLPMILALNMSDQAEKEGLEIDADYLASQLEVPVIEVSGRTGQGMESLKREMQTILLTSKNKQLPNKSFYPLSKEEEQIAHKIAKIIPVHTNFQAVLIAHHYQRLPFLHEIQRISIQETLDKSEFVSLRQQVEETMIRFDTFTPIVRKAFKNTKPTRSTFTGKLDAILTHRIGGPLIFVALMTLVFQAIFAWATYPMDWIESIFIEAGGWVKYVLGSGWLSSLIADGILAGLGGVLVFIPQIAILFFIISILEELGYMARAAFIFDRIMQFFGMNGRSVVALISGGACAIPAIMSTRTIGNWKERLITIMVTPLISCSARIPVYIVLIAFVVPSEAMGGWGQGLAMMGLYLLGIVVALLSALVFKYILKSREHSFLMLELPEYRAPMLRNVGLTVWEKVKSFVTEAGKIIIVISIILWALSSFAPPGQMVKAETAAKAVALEQELDYAATQDLIAAQKMEASYAGILGKAIEPAIKPLGFDWKIGIALITSFAAREVFVGTMATIYSIGSVNDESSIRERMAKERNPVTGKPVYTLATALSLLVFYVFAMQCMSTLAVVKRETNSWKWPIIQFAFMSGLAYLSSLLVYQILA
ncbi:MAG: ferrous iron transport protein B [Saprospiraceae bacterium]|nr:ferrous iron transport protein B [Saprospiraceae bacterium]